MDYVGICFLYGQGVQMNTAFSAVSWQHSSDLKNAFGEFNLGCCYDEGGGMPKIPEKARNLFEAAAGFSKLLQAKAY
jgi:TPR repeat protein